MFLRICTHVPVFCSEKKRYYQLLKIILNIVTIRNSIYDNKNKPVHFTILIILPLHFYLCAFFALFVHFWAAKFKSTLVSAFL